MRILRPASSRLARGLVCLVFAMGLWLAPWGTSAARADVLSYVGLANGNFDELDITTGKVTLLNNAGVLYEGLAFGPSNVLYGIMAPSVSSPASLYTVNTTTGTPTLVGSTGVALTTLTSLSNGALYGVGLNDNLYSINSSTGAATLIGANGLANLSSIDFENSLASDGTNLYYTLGTSGGTDILYKLNLTTGAATEIGSTGTTGIAGSVFAGPTFATGQLYGFLTNGNVDTINTTTGQATHSGTENAPSAIYGGVGIVESQFAATPEPSSLALLGIGTTGIAGYGWRRKRKAATVPA
jgi:hypothetical protein